MSRTFTSAALGFLVMVFVSVVVGTLIHLGAPPPTELAIEGTTSTGGANGLNWPPPVTMIMAAAIFVFSAVVIAAEFHFLYAARALWSVIKHELPRGGPIWQSEEELADLEQALNEKPDLGPLAGAVREITEATFHRGPVLRNAYQAGDFIDAAWFRAAAGPHIISGAVVAAAPGLLTALGILGTFIGLIAGLPTEMDSSNADIAINQLLSGLGVSFWTSVLGLSASMAVTVVSRGVEGHAESAIETFVSRLDARLTRGTTQELLEEIHSLLHQSQTQAAIADQARRNATAKSQTALDALVVQQSQATDQLKRLNTDLSTALIEAVDAIADQHIAPTFERLERHSDAMRLVATELAEGAAREQVTGVERIVDQVVQGLDNSVGAQAKEAAEALTEYADQQRGLLDAWRLSINSLDTATGKYATAVGEQESLTGRINDILAPANTLAQSYATALSSFREALTPLASSLAGLQRLQEGFAQVTEQQAELGKANQEQGLLLSQSFSDQADTIRSTWGDFEGSLGSAAADLLPQLTEVGRFMKQATEQLSGVALQVKEASDAARLVHQEQRQGQREWITAMDATQSAAAALSPAATELHQASRAMSEAGQLATGVTSSLVTAASSYQSGAIETARTLQATTAALVTAREDWATVMRGIRVVSDDLGQGMDQFVGQFPGSITKVMVHFDEAMGEGVQKLAAANRQLEDVLEELTDAMAELARSVKSDSTGPRR